MKEVKFCKYCGHKFGPNARFCGVCGKEIIRPEAVATEIQARPVAEEHVVLNVSAPAKQESVTTAEAKKDIKSKIDFTDIKEKIGNSTENKKEFKATGGAFYVLDLFKRIFSGGNLPVAIYLVLNVFVIGFIFQLVFAGFNEGITAKQLISCYTTALVIYLISITLALSPLGEFILRFQNGCKKIKDKEHISRIEPLFREVYEKAKLADKSLADDIRLFISKDGSANAFATGRKTICITEGLLYESDDRIKAVLAHEFGHLAHKDTDLILLVVVGNFIFSAILVILKLIILLIDMILSVGMFLGKAKFIHWIAESVCSILTMVFINFTMWIWTKIGFLLVMKSNRNKEYRADEFALNTGNGYALCEFLDGLHEAPPKGLFATLANSHPDNSKRIIKLQELGCTYKRSL